jgi:signal transduction histidine kinase
MRRWSFKVKVGVYAALVTMTALLAGGVVMMATLYFHQSAGLNEVLAEEAEELVWDLKMFRDAPSEPGEALRDDMIPVPLRERYLEVETLEGKLVYRSPNLKGSALEVEPGRIVSRRMFGEACRVGAWREGPYLVRIGAKLEVIDAFMKRLVFGFAAALPAVGLVVFLGGVWLARRTVAPLAELSAAAERISAGNPRERLPAPPARDEIARLTEVLNRSFDRLEASYQIAVRFSADASHQLKTPVTILRAGLDELMRMPDTGGDPHARVAMLLQQTRRLGSVIDDLLLLAQADAGRVNPEREPVDLRGLAEAAADDLMVLVAERDIRVDLEVMPELRVLADRRLVSMALQNLVENAAKYTPPGGEIRIDGEHAAGMAVLRISNTGSGIPLPERERIFDRFRRVDETGRKIGGHGLGLNIARELIRAHGGEVRLADGAPGWTVFELVLPCGAAPV